MPAKTFIETKDSGGEFLRVNSKGNKVIFGDLAQSGQNRTVLLDIDQQGDEQKHTINRIKTPFNDETYPVDTLSDEWTLIASPNHDGKMRYYELGEVQKNGGNAKPVFEDSNNDYYHSTAELKGSGENRKLVRTLLWKNQKYADYEYTKGDHVKSSSMKPLQSGRVCQNIVMEGLSPSERNEEEKTRKLLDKVSDELTLEVSALKAQGKTEADIEKSEALKKIAAQMENIKLNDKVKNFDQPILNKTGDKVAAVVGTTLKIFQINEDKTCKELQDLGTYTSKARFSYPMSKGVELVSYKKKIFEGSELVDRVVILNMKTGSETVVPTETPVSSFIEFIKDGRIFFYSAPKEGPKGYWLMDLNQISPTGQIKTDNKTCIKQAMASRSSSKSKEDSGVR
ncbi:MAG: hypothetical protein JNM24_05890 [Bdellovibrionaceae bacterium]|nr:hypothetical protein [Pseudobdellovibrionaceae bacterium]